MFDQNREPDRQSVHWHSRNKLATTRIYIENGGVIVGRNEVEITKEEHGEVDLRIDIYINDVHTFTQVILGGTLPDSHMRIRPEG